MKVKNLEANKTNAIAFYRMAYEGNPREARQWTPEEVELLMEAGELGPGARVKYRGKPIQYYLDIWDEVRARTLAGLRERDDAWFASNIEEGLNNHYVWFHVMEHSANHMGQIALVKNRLPD